jgi:hypothetical protein
MHRSNFFNISNDGRKKLDVSKEHTCEPCKNQINEKLYKKWKTKVWAELLIGRVKEAKLKTVFCRRLK